MKFLTIDDAGVLILVAKVAEHGSFSAAAKELKLSRSVVSKRISHLEKKIGVCLFLRTTRKVNLTESGIRILSYCNSMKSSLSEINNELENENSGEHGVIRINAPGLFIERQLLPVIENYSSEYKNIEFDLNSDDSMIDTASGNYDLVIRIASKLTQQSIISRTIATDRLVIVGAPNYLLKHGVPQSPFDLVRHNCMRYSPRTTFMEWRFIADKNPYSVGIQSKIYAGDDASLRSAAIEGMGLAIMPRCFVNKELQNGDLESVLETDMWEPERTIYGIYPEGHLAPKRVSRFVGELSEALKQTNFHTLDVAKKSS